MKILFATSEAAPYWKTGGLADVARALPDELVARGHDVRIVHPYYRVVRERGDPVTVLGVEHLPWPSGGMPVRYLEHRPERGATTVFVDQPYFFDVAAPYGPTRFDSFAAGRRFALFCRAIVRWARTWGADVVHLNDWPTGLVPVYGRIDGLGAPTVFAIHNLAYQGNFPPSILGEIGVPDEYFRTEDGVEFYGTASFMKAGLALSDRLVTVSPTYAEEIQTPEYGAGMDRLLRHRRGVLEGILNGIDPRTWNPATDEAIEANYDEMRLHEKERNREALLAEVGLDGAGPVLAMVSRLVEQKGIDLVVSALPELLQIGARLLVLGDGDLHYEQALARAVADHPRRVAAFFRFDDRLARRIYAGADFFLMPSHYEPCGLGQMIAQRYGTPPIVRQTGGLKDTVEDDWTGFVFRSPEPAALVSAVDRAVRLWNGEGVESMRRRCMQLDWSWHRSAGRYEALYEAALAG